MKLQMQAGTDSIGHGEVNYVVSNIDWCVTVPDHVGHAILANGRTGARLVEEPEASEGEATEESDLEICEQCGCLRQSQKKE